LLEKLHKAHEKNEYYEKPKKRGSNFIVKHYAGEVLLLYIDLAMFIAVLNISLTYQVSYETKGFLEKNRDTLGADILAALQTSKMPLIISLFPDKLDIGGKKPPTVGMQFKARNHNKPIPPYHNK